MKAPLRSDVRCLPLGTTRTCGNVQYMVVGYEPDHHNGGTTEIWKRVTPLSDTEHTLKRTLDTHAAAVSGVDIPYTID